MIPADWPSRDAMKGHRAARVTEAARILLTPSTLPVAIKTKPPRCCRGRILFGSAIDRRDIEADLFERYCDQDLHLVLPVIAPEEPWVFDRHEVGHRRDGVLVWHHDYRLWMASAEEHAWLVPGTSGGPSFRDTSGELIAMEAPYTDEHEREAGLRTAARAMSGLVDGRY